MNLRTVVGGYAVLVGAAMVTMWTALFATGQVVEAHRAPVELAYHLTAEGATALALLAGGVAVFRGRGWARRLLPVALGMLLYTVVNSAGYYAGLGETPMVATFGVLTVGTVAAIWVVLARPAALQGPRRGRSPTSKDGRTVQ